MTAAPRSGWRLSIRLQSLLLLPLMLAIPFVGYQYVREMENFLRKEVEDSVAQSARGVAILLEENPSYFRARGVNTSSREAFTAHPSAGALEIDGYRDDWEPYLSGLVAFDEASKAGSDLSARYLLGKYKDHLYLLWIVEDDQVIYRQFQDPTPYESDHLQIGLKHADGRTERFALSTSGPGRVSAYQLPSPSESVPLRIDVRIRAAWQPTATGYVLEIRMPVHMLGEKLGFHLADRDHNEPLQAPRIRLRPLVLPSDPIEALIQRVATVSGRRVWVTDNKGRVIARTGSLERDEAPVPINPIYSLLLSPPSDELFEERSLLTKLTGEEMDAALAASRAQRWRATQQDNVWIVSAAHPVMRAESVIGAVMVEESSLGIQTVTREALSALFNRTLIVSLFGALCLVLFATRLATRLGRLRDQTEASIDAYGRVTGALAIDHGRDEIGDLSNSFATLLARLREYNHYLEQLARRLSHELRTPLAIVRSSLESLALDPSKETTALYSARAQEGLTRLDSVITRLSEASRLEAAIQSAEVEIFDPMEVLTGTVSAYQATWPDRPMVLRGISGQHRIAGSPDLLVQLLDKLVSNAIELGAPQSPIEFDLDAEFDTVTLSVTNYGSTLPVSMRERLFDSMVSVRTEPGSSPHLGLGLYIARLIAEFHKARISAQTLPEDAGVKVSIRFPVLDPVQSTGSL